MTLNLDNIFEESVGLAGSIKELALAYPKVRQKWRDHKPKKNEGICLYPTREGLRGELLLTSTAIVEDKGLILYDASVVRYNSAKDDLEVLLHDDIDFPAHLFYKDGERGRYGVLKDYVHIDKDIFAAIHVLLPSDFFKWSEYCLSSNHLLDPRVPQRAFLTLYGPDDEGTISRKQTMDLTKLYWENIPPEKRSNGIINAGDGIEYDPLKNEIMITHHDTGCHFSQTLRQYVTLNPDKSSFNGYQVKVINTWDTKETTEPENPSPPPEVPLVRIEMQEIPHAYLPPNHEIYLSFSTPLQKHVHLGTRQL